MKRIHLRARQGQGKCKPAQVLFDLFSAKIKHLDLPYHGYKFLFLFKTHTPQPQQLQTNSFEAQISKPKQSGAQESGDDAGFD